MLNTILNSIVAVTSFVNSTTNYEKTPTNQNIENIYQLNEQDDIIDTIWGSVNGALGIAGTINPIAGGVGLVSGIAQTIYSSVNSGSVYTSPDAIDNTYVNGYSHGSAYSNGCTNMAGYGC